jgi:maspardin
MLPPASGTADVFFKQQLSLGTSGYRVIAVDYPPCWSHDDWCESFLKLLDQLKLDQVHIFGASLGAFLAQKFVRCSFFSRFWTRF